MSASSQPSLTSGLVDPKVETRRQKLFKLLGPKAGGSMQIGYEAGKLLATGDQSGVTKVAELLQKNGAV